MLLPFLLCFEGCVFLSKQCSVSTRWVNLQLHKLHITFPIPLSCTVVLALIDCSRPHRSLLPTTANSHRRHIWLTSKGSILIMRSVQGLTKESFSQCAMMVLPGTVAWRSSCIPCPDRQIVRFRPFTYLNVLTIIGCTMSNPLERMTRPVTERLTIIFPIWRVHAR